MQSDDLAFRLLYNLVFSVLTVLLVALLVITPADAIKQALHNNQLYNVFVVAGCYLLTFILASLIYASRIYTNRSVLASIPKTFIPVETEDLKKSVRKMIVEGLNKSALIAWEASPRINNAGRVADAEANIATSAQENTEDRNRMTRRMSNTALTTNIPPHPPVWGEISHRGWSSPLSADLPNLQYITVIQELPNLIEAKAVSLAPTDPITDPPLPDLRAVEILQRPATLGLREYTTQLINLHTISDPSLANNLIISYERARFSTKPISEHEFRHLMKMFADLLRCMTPLDPAIFDADNPGSMVNESDIDDDASSKSTPITLESRSLASKSRSVGVSRIDSEGTIRTAMSRRPGTNGSHSQSQSQANRDSTSLRAGLGSTSNPLASTSKGRSLAGLGMTSMSSTSSLHQARSLVKSQRSSSSLRSSRSGGSVIRLNLNVDHSELPYIIG